MHNVAMAGFLTIFKLCSSLQQLCSYVTCKDLNRIDGISDHIGEGHAWKEVNIDRYPLIPFVYGIEKSSHLQIPLLKLNTSNICRHCYILLQKADFEFMVCSVCEDWGPGLSNDHRTLGWNGFGHANCQQWLGVHQIICNWAHTEVHVLGSWTGWDDHAFRYKSAFCFCRMDQFLQLNWPSIEAQLIMCEYRLLGVL